MKECPYEILGLDKNVSVDEVKKQYRKLAKQYHPDKQTGKEDQFLRIKEAYDSIANGTENEENFIPQSFGENAYENLNSYINNIFGSIPFVDPHGMFFSFHHNSIPPSKNDDMHRIDISLSESDVFYGCHRKLDFECADKCKSCDGFGFDSTDKDAVRTCERCNGTACINVSQFFSVPCDLCQSKGTIVYRPCQTCEGTGTIYRKRAYDIKCPSGIPDGHTTIMRQKGPYNTIKRLNSDLLICFTYGNFSDKLTIKNNRDVHIKLPVTLTEALFGFRRVIQVYREQYELKKVGYTDPKKQLCIHGQGLPSLSAAGKSGDIFISIIVEFPDDWDVNSNTITDTLLLNGSPGFDWRKIES